MKPEKLRRKRRLVERLEAEIASKPKAPGPDRLPKGKEYTNAQWLERLKKRLEEAKTGMRG